MNLLDILFPRRCVSCGKFGRYFCQNCHSSIKLFQPQICPVCGRPAINGATHPRCQTRNSLDGLTSFFRYEGIIRKGVKALKYRLVSDLAKEFINLIPSYLLGNETMRQLSNDASLLPIPLHPSRLHSRGFNQAEVLGKILAKQLNIPLNNSVLRRIRKTIPQVEMKDRKKRLKNMEGVFKVNNLTIKQFNNGNFLLFDDVFTTGATLRSAASVLKRHGVKYIWGMVLAHG